MLKLGGKKEKKRKIQLQGIAEVLPTNECEQKHHLLGGVQTNLQQTALWGRVQVEAKGKTFAYQRGHNC